MLKSISKASILKLPNYFDTYMINHGIGSLYPHILPGILKGIFFNAVPPVSELNNERVRAQLMKWVKTSDLQDIKTVYKKEINMNYRSANI